MPTYRKYDVQYTAYSSFYIPIEYDIHDKNIVKEFYIDCSNLKLILSDGKEISIAREELNIDLENPDDPWIDLWEHFELVDLEEDTEDD
jgi:hypothetical protein